MLKGVNYMSTPITQLVHEPDFSEKAFQKMVLISNLSTEEIEALDIPGYEEDSERTDDSRQPSRG
jgi:hypothetical protein